MGFLDDAPSILGLYGLKVMSALTQAVPIGVAYRVSTVVADVVFLAWRSLQRDTMTNMRHVLGPTASAKQVRATARQAMRNYFLVLVEFLSLRKLTRAEVMARLHEVRGLEHLEWGLARGQGVILVGVHHGSWDMAGVAATSYNLSITAVADTYRYPPLNEWIFAPRMAWGGIHLLSVREPQTLRQAFRILKRNEILALVVDRPMNGEGIPVRFFGADLSFPQGAAAIALRTGATIIPGYFIRRPDNTFMAEVLPPVEYTPCGDPQKDVQGLTQALVTRLEEIIRRYPEQWYAFQLLWDEDCQATERTC